MKDPAVTLKVAPAAFAGIETVDGIEILPVELNATVAPVATGLPKVTVQAATAPGASVEGEQEIPLRPEVRMADTVPPVGLIATCLPSIATPTAPEIPIGAELAVAASVTDTVATLPFAIRLVFIPLVTHV